MLLNSFSRFISVVVLSAIILSGCATSVGNRASFENTKFVIGETDKHSVASVLGLPSEVSRSDNLLLWGYPESPKLSGLIIAVPTAPDVVSTYAIDVTDESDLAQSQMVYGFDEAGILRQVSDQRSNKE